MHTGIIDAHTHIFPDNIPSEWEWYANKDDNFRALTEVTSNTKVFEIWTSPDEAIEVADKAGIEKIVMQGWYWKDRELCVRHNDFMAKIIKDYPQRFLAFACVNPVDDKAVDEVKRAHSLGFIGVGELGPKAQGYRLDDKKLTEVLKVCDKLGMIVNFHAGEPVGREYPGKDMTPIRGFYEIAKAHPDLKIILSHLGGGLLFYEMMPEVKKVLKNVWYDLAALPLLYDIKSIRRVIDICGVNKILYGSDFPLTLYPTKTKERDFSLFINDICDNAELTSKEKDLIFRDNFNRLVSSC